MTVLEGVLLRFASLRCRLLVSLLQPLPALRKTCSVLSLGVVKRMRCAEVLHGCRERFPHTLPLRVPHKCFIQQ
jgi:hypothetical protein